MITVHNLEDTKFTARLFRFLYPSFLHPYYLIISLFFFCIFAFAFLPSAPSLVSSPCLPSLLSSLSSLIFFFPFFFSFSFSSLESRISISRRGRSTRDLDHRKFHIIYRLLYVCFIHLTCCSLSLNQYDTRRDARTTGRRFPGGKIGESVARATRQKTMERRSREICFASFLKSSFAKSRSSLRKNN